MSLVWLTLVRPTGLTAERTCSAGLLGLAAQLGLLQKQSGPSAARSLALSSVLAGACSQPHPLEGSALQRPAVPCDSGLTGGPGGQGVGARRLLDSVGNDPPDLHPGIPHLVSHFFHKIFH